MYSSYQVNKLNRLNDMLLEAAKENDYMKLINALDEGADVNVKDNWGNNSLHYAVKNRNNLIVRALLERDIDVNSLNGYGETALTVAINNFDVRNITDIYSMGGLVNAPNNLTPLLYVLTSNLQKKYEIADILLNVYPDSNEIVNGRSAVKYLELLSKFNEAKYLRARGGF